MHLSDIQSSPGSVAQVRECASFLTRYAKTRQVAIIMVGHVTKDGTLAGPKVLEHAIDCSLLLEGEADSRFRTLRSHKNRFGAVNELGRIWYDRARLARSEKSIGNFLKSREMNKHRAVSVMKCFGKERVRF